MRCKTPKEKEKSSASEPARIPTNALQSEHCRQLKGQSVLNCQPSLCLSAWRNSAGAEERPSFSAGQGGTVCLIPSWQLPCTLLAEHVVPMQKRIETRHVRRTWIDKIKMWRRAYETKIFDESREAFGRGPTCEASRMAAERRWIAELPMKERLKV